MRLREFSLRNLWLVTRREYRVRVRTRAFLVSTVATPMLFAIFIFLPALIAQILSKDIDTGTRRMVIVCGDPSLASVIQSRIAMYPHPNHEVMVDHEASPVERARLDAQLAHGAIVAYAWLDPDAIATGGADYRSIPDGGHYRYFYLRQILAEALAQARLARDDLKSAQIQRALRPVDLRMEHPAKEPHGLSSLLMADSSALLLAYVLFFSFVSYGAMLMQSVIEEKFSRITELLLVSTRPEELMGGKILGVGFVGLTQIAIWLVLAVGFASTVPEAREAFARLHLSGTLYAYFVLFYLLGYLLFSVLYAVAGVSADGTHRASQWTMVIMLPILSALTLLPVVSAEPDSPLAAIASMIPYLAPILMYARVALGAPPLWQVALSVLLIAITIAVSTVLCARIYRVGILMYGKRPTLREMIQWLRYA